MYRLAFLLHKTVGEIRQMPMSEFTYWQAYFRLHPPEQPALERTAALMATITNMSGRSLPAKKFVTPDDMLGRRKVQTAEQQIAFMKGLGRG